MIVRTRTAVAALLCLVAMLPLCAFASIECPANVQTLSDGAPACVDGSGDVVAWEAVPPFDVSQLDVTQAGEAFAAGFVIVGMCWALGRAVSAILAVIRR